MRTLFYQHSFKVDFKKLKNSEAKKRKILEAIELLQTTDSLPDVYKEHPLKGKYSGTLECHVAPDLLLVYTKTTDSVTFLRVGSHSELFR